MNELLTRNEEKELFKRIEQGDIEARDKVIKCNMRLVYKAVRRYFGRGLEVEDLVQEGCIGLMHAIQKFDYRKGFKFSTYAVWWIRETMSRALEGYGRIIRLPVKAGIGINKLKVARGKFLVINGRQPTIEELAQAADMDLSRVEYISGLDYEEISLDFELDSDDDGTATTGDFIIDEGAYFEDQVCNEASSDAMQEVLSILTPREREIVKMRFGFYGKKYRLMDVGKKLGLTAERIRQLEKHALNKLKTERVKEQFKELKPEI